MKHRIFWAFALMTAMASPAWADHHEEQHAQARQQQRESTSKQSRQRETRRQQSQRSSSQQLSAEERREALQHFLAGYCSGYEDGYTDSNQDAVLYVFATKPTRAQQARRQTEGQRQHAQWRNRLRGEMRNRLGAQPRDGRRQPQLQTVSGRVLNTKNVNFRNTDVTHQVVLLRTGEGQRKVVDLGPIQNLRENDIRLTRGERIAVRGIPARVGDFRVLFAKDVRADNQTVAVKYQGLQQAGQRDIRRFSRDLEGSARNLRNERQQGSQRGQNQSQQNRENADR